MAIKVGGTEVISDTKQFRNLTGVSGNYTNLQPTAQVSTVTGTHNPTTDRTTHFINLTGAWTCQNISGASAGDQLVLFVNTSTALYDITFQNSGGSVWHFTNDSEPDWTTARYWQISITCFSSNDHMVSATSWGASPGTANTTESFTAGSVSFGTQVGIHHMSPGPGTGYTKTYNGTGGMAYGYSVSQAENNANLDGDYAFCDYTSSLIITSTSVTGDQLTSYGYSDSTGWAWRHWGQGTDEELDITPPDITYTHTEAGLNVDSETGIGSLGSWDGQYTSDDGTVWEVQQILWCRNTRTSGTFPNFTPYNGSDVVSGDGGNWVTLSLKKISGTYGTTDGKLFKSIQIGSLSLSRSDGSVQGNGSDFVSVCWNGGTSGGMTDTDITGGPGESTGSKTLKIFTE